MPHTKSKDFSAHAAAAAAAAIDRTRSSSSTNESPAPSTSSSPSSSPASSSSSLLTSSSSSSSLLSSSSSSSAFSAPLFPGRTATYSNSRSVSVDINDEIDGTDVHNRTSSKLFRVNVVDDDSVKQASKVESSFSRCKSRICCYDGLPLFGIFVIIVVLLIVITGGFIIIALADVQSAITDVGRTANIISVVSDIRILLLTINLTLRNFILDPLNTSFHPFDAIVDKINDDIQTLYTMQSSSSDDVNPAILTELQTGFDNHMVALTGLYVNNIPSFFLSNYTASKIFSDAPSSISSLIPNLTQSTYIQSCGSDFDSHNIVLVRCWLNVAAVSSTNVSSLLGVMYQSEIMALSPSQHQASQHLESVIISTGPMLLVAIVLLFLVVIYIIRSLKQSYTARQAKLSAKLLDAKHEIERKSTLLAVMSHELRTPMNGIIALSELLSLTKLDSEQSDLLSTVRSCATSMMSLVNDLLTFIKLDTTHFYLSYSLVSLSDIVKTIKRLYLPITKNKHIAFDIDVDEELSDITVYIDRDRLLQVLINLLDNACKFTTKGSVQFRIKKVEKPYQPKHIQPMQQHDQATDSMLREIVTSSTSPEPKHCPVSLTDGECRDNIFLQFSVVDTGAGIAEDMLSSIFQPFVQGDMSFSRAYGGTGLGLSIASEIVHLMGGDIRVQSQINQGSSFDFTVDCHVHTNTVETHTQYDRINSKLNIDSTVSQDKLYHDVNTNTAISCSNGDHRLHHQYHDRISHSLRDSVMPSIASFAWVPSVLQYVDHGTEMSSLPASIKFHRCPSDTQSMSDDEADTQYRRSSSIDSQSMPPRHTQSPQFHAYRSPTESTYNSPTNNNSGSFSLGSHVDTTASLSMDGVSITSFDTSMLTSSTAPLSSLDILLAEDNIVNQKVAKKLLSFGSHTVTIAADGEIAIQKYQDKIEATGQPYDVILMDIQMPNVDGILATQRIREIESNYPDRAHQIIIALTANVMDGDRDKCLKAGMDGFLSKPLTIASLNAQLKPIQQAKPKSKETKTGKL